MEINHHQRTLGVVPLDDGTTAVKIWSPLADSVAIQTIPEGNIIPLTRADHHFWITKTDQLQSGNQYKVIINEEAWPDPTSVYQPEGVHGPSEVKNLRNHPWKLNEWKNIPLSEYIIYELHTGTFSSEGTFQGIINKLDYLVDLGITAIEIMPVAQFPGNRNWGYDGAYLFAVQNSYGGPEALQQLVDACHEKGLAVILDVVYNHFGPEGNYAAKFGPIFTDKYKTPWGQSINFDDAYCDGVRAFFIENALMWFRDFRIDALRMDAVQAIRDLSPKHILREMNEHIRELEKITGQKHYTIAEVDLNDTRFINPTGSDGYGMDAQWVDEFHHALRVAAGGQRIGYYSDFNGVEHLAKAYSEVYVYNGNYSAHRKRRFGTKVKDHHRGEQFVVFAQNHDQVGNRMMGERLGELVSFEMQKLLAGATLASPFLPFLFMGEEYSEKNPFQYFVHHGDADLIAAVQKGRIAEFEAFFATGNAPDPQSEATFVRSKLNWNLPNQSGHKELLAYYRKLILLRKTDPVMKQLNRKNLSVSIDASKNTLLLRRWTESADLICPFNFSPEAQHIEWPSPEKIYRKLICSTDLQWLGKKDAPSEISGMDEILLQPESFSIYLADV